MSPYILLTFGFLALLVVFILAALVEGVVLTLLSWNPFKDSMTTAVIMNLIAGVFNSLLLIFLQNNPFVWIYSSFVLSLIVDGFILSWFKRTDLRRNLLFSLLANLASYVLLILPAYYYGASL